MRALLGFLVCAALCAGARADDSSAALAMGGIVFTHGTAVRMAAEDLYVSPKAVRIRFVFANDTAKDIDTIVAFPLPDIDENEFSESPLGTITQDAVNFVGFKAAVDGKPVPFAVERRAFYKGKDVTALLNAAGAPLNALSETKAFDAIAGAKRKALLAADLVDEESGDGLHPHWLLRTKFYWPQRFPAHKSVVIEHSYQPVTGQFFFDKGAVADKTLTKDQDYCFDAPTKARLAAMAAARLRAKADNGAYLNAYTTDYILKTANNWNGPIGRFHLTLDKLKPTNALSLCWDGDLKKTGPTTFEAVRENFAPARDIHMLVLE